MTYPLSRVQANFPASSHPFPMCLGLGVHTACVYEQTIPPLGDGPGREPVSWEFWCLGYQEGALEREAQLPGSHIPSTLDILSHGERVQLDKDQHEAL